MGINPCPWLLAPCSGSVGESWWHKKYIFCYKTVKILVQYFKRFGVLFLFFFFSLVLKEEASDYLELDTVKNLVKKYSQFINFPIYVWSSKVSVFN